MTARIIITLVAVAAICAALVVADVAAGWLLRHVDRRWHKEAGR